jgi:hypothetical protein
MGRLINRIRKAFAIHIVMPTFFIKRIYPSESLPTYPYKVGEEWLDRGYVKSVTKLIGNYVFVVFQNGA